MSHLQKRACRGVTCELGVAYLVGIVAEIARHAVHAHEEVGVSEPRGLEQSGLEDDVDSGVKGIDRFFGSCANGCRCLVDWSVDLGDFVACIAESGEHGLLVHVAASGCGGVEGLAIDAVRLKLDSGAAHIREIGTQVGLHRCPGIQGRAVVAAEPPEQVTG